MTQAVDGTTGRFLVLLDDDWSQAGRELNRVAGLRAETPAPADLADVLHEAPAVIMDELGVAVVDADPEQVEALAMAVAEPGPIIALEPERVLYALDAEPGAEAGDAVVDVNVDAAVAETVFTWGLQAVGAANSTATGQGIRVAVLDTGLDLGHPDYVGRVASAAAVSFVQGEQVQDGNGHGTHTVGTACGPRTAGQDRPGYGIASNAEVFVGKVLSNRGSGADGGLLSGISWAMSNNCAVVSMSLGAPTAPGQAFSATFEQVARRALDRGTLIIAAAGNESDRTRGIIRPVGHPANCPSVMAVGAVDSQLRVAPFSCGTVDRIGSVDIVGPGVDVYSSWPTPLRYRRLAGTSMATPHVAGVAALIAQATGARGYALWARLAQTAQRLPVASTDAGSGLVQAP
jgi:subtilisin